VGVAEKGWANVQLTVRQPPGHSSVPPATTAIGILSRAIARLEAAPFPARVSGTGPVAAMFKALAPSLPLHLRAIFANMWLTSPIVRAVMLGQPQTAAMVRTTTAVTVVSGGTKANVLPSTATAIVNHRIEPSETVASVLARDAAIIADPRVVVTPEPDALEPSPLSSHTCAAFRVISGAVLGIYDRTIVAPALMIGNTDTRHYWGLAEQLYRHCPVEMHRSETAMFHGVDERIRVDSLARLCAFYARVVLTAAAAGPEGGL
jgi:carboxypeptidase PM20D1